VAGVTRAQYGTTVFTNSLSGLAREVEHLDVKSSSLDPFPKPEIKAPRVQGSDLDDSGHPSHRAVTVTGEYEKEKERERSNSFLEVAGKRAAPAEQVKASSMIGKDGAGKLPLGEHGKHPSGPTREKFDRGAKFSKRVDELARAGELAHKSLNELLQNLGRPLPSVGREIVKQLPKIPVKGIDMDIDI